MLQPRCSIVIRCYNEERHIGRLLEGILQQTIQNVEIIIVDSGSTDATLEVASKYPVRIVNINPQEFSFGRSLNLGLENTHGKLVILASAHVYPVYSDWLEQLIAPFENPRVALTYGKQRGNSLTQYSEYRVFEHWFPDEPMHRQTHPFCNNANTAIQRELWLSNPYDEELTGLEDLAWAKRVIDQGYYLAYVSEAEVTHVHSETPLQTYNRYRREAIAFKQIFPQERFHFWNFIQLWLSNTYSDWQAAKKERILKRNFLSIARFRLMQFWGTYRGYNQPKLISRKLRQTFYYPNKMTPLNRDGGKVYRRHLRIPYDPIEKEV